MTAKEQVMQEIEGLADAIAMHTVSDLLQQDSKKASVKMMLIDLCEMYRIAHKEDDLQNVIDKLNTTKL